MHNSLKKNLAFFVFTCCFFPIFCEAKLNAGDMVGYYGAFNGLGNNKAQHAGIYTGSDEDSVIEFVVPSPGMSAKIIKTPLKSFREASSNKKIFKYKVESFSKIGKTRPAKKVVECAKSYLQDGGKDFGVYDVFYNNCQHFATYCKFGVKHSWQSKKLELLLSGLGVGSNGMKLFKSFSGFLSTFF